MSTTTGYCDISNLICRFSVNFSLDSCSTSRNIAYHFKTDFVNNKVIHNYKTVDNWNDEIIEENTWIQGAGHEFVLKFHFDDNEFLVYSDDENLCFQYRFDYKFDIRDIKSMQVWDDVEYVDELIFRYKKISNY